MDASVEAAVAEAHRAEWGFVLAATLRVAGDIDVAGECAQDAYAKALASWPKAGVPRSPGAWLTTVARRRALDVGRRRSVGDRLAPLVAEAATTDVDEVETVVEADMVEVADDRLRLIFTCCHPSIAYVAHVALTLRLVCGLATSEVARAFLVSEPTMAARLTRAKKKIAAARIPYRVPSVDELPTHIDAVLSVVHLIFTTGHTAPAGVDLVRRDQGERAVELARTLASLLSDDADVAGLLALVLLAAARGAARLDEHGALVLLADQDPTDWDRAAIAESVSAPSARRWLADHRGVSR